MNPRTSIENDIRLILGSNADAYTLAGTNSWLLGVRGADDLILVDPGPDRPDHVENIMSAVAGLDGAIGQVILTHAHDDHLGALWRVLRRSGPIPVVSALKEIPETIETSWSRFEIIATPGHTFDSLCVLEPSTGRLLTGDTILGQGPTMIDYPDGSLTDYLASLEKLITLPGLRSIHPGHGRVRTDPYDVLTANLSHRRTRAEDVRSAAAHLGTNPDAITNALYPEITTELREGARQNTIAALQHFGLLKNSSAARKGSTA